MLHTTGFWNRGEIIPEIPDNGLVVHLDGNNLPYELGDRVSLWEDISGLGNDFNQPTAARRPTKADIGINCGGTGFMRGTNAGSGRNTLGEFTLGIVFSAPDITSNQVLYSLGDTEIIFQPYLVIQNNLIRFNTRLADNTLFSIDAPITTNTVYTVITTWGMPEMNLYVDADLQATGAGRNIIQGTFISEALGCRNNAINNVFTGNIRAFTMYNRELSLSEIDQLNGYLQGHFT